MNSHDRRDDLAGHIVAALCAGHCGAGSWLPTHLWTWSSRNILGYVIGQFKERYPWVRLGSICCSSITANTKDLGPQYGGCFRDTLRAPWHTANRKGVWWRRSDPIPHIFHG